MSRISLFLCIIALVFAKYQFLAEKDIIDVVTVSKDDALRRIRPGDGPSYIMTKKRKQWFAHGLDDE